jgi:D-tyrosyl-tRNA(Tyr) deacylase
VRAVVQRVRSARVTVADEVVAQIGLGLCVLLGVADVDGEAEAVRLASRLARLRIFENEEGKFDRSVRDVDGAALVVSQFTLMAESRRQKGTRPDFSGAAPKERAERLYLRLCEELRALDVPVATGVFGARMAVELVNDGPVTIIVET